MSLQTQIESYTGALPAGLTGELLEEILANGVSDIIRKVKLTNPSELWLFTKTESVSEAGLSVDTSLVYDVELGSKPCSFIDVHKRFRAADENSIEFASAEFPVYYVLDGKVFVIPSPGSVSLKAIDAWATYDVNGVGTQTKVTTNSAHGFVANDWVSITKTDEDVASTADKYYIGYYRVASIVDTENFIIDRNYVATTDTSYHAAQAAATCTHVSVPSHTTIDVGTNSISNFPDQYLGLVILYGAMAVLQKRISSMYSSLPSISLAAPPVAPPLQQTSVSIEGFVPPSPFIVPLAPNGGSIDFSSVPSIPTTNKVLAPPVTAFTFPVESISIPSMALPGLPVAPEAPSFDSGIADFTTLVRSKEPSYSKPVLEVVPFPAINALSVPEPPAAPINPSISSGQSSAANSNVPTYAPAVLGDLEFDTVVKYIETEEDSELASAQLQKIQTKISVHQQQSVEALNQFNEELNEYKSKIEEAQFNASNEMNSDDKEYQALLAKHANEIQLYQIHTQNVITEWGKTEIENKFSKWSADVQNAIATYTQEIQNELNLFNKDVTIYQAELQKAMADAVNLSQKDKDEYANKLAKYQAELESYKAHTTNIISEWTAKDAQIAMTEFSTKRNDTLTKWTQDNTFALQVHQQEVQEEAGRLNNEIAIWQGEITKASTKFQLEDASATAIYQAKVGSETSRYESDLKNALETYNAKINQMQVDVGRITEENQAALSKYQQENTTWAAETQNEMATYQNLLTGSEKEFNYYINQYQVLKNEYDGSFVIQQNQNKEQ